MSIGLFERGLNRDLAPASQTQIRPEIGVFGLGASFQNQSGSSCLSPSATQALGAETSRADPRMNPEKLAKSRGVGG